MKSGKQGEGCATSIFHLNVGSKCQVFKVVVSSGYNKYYIGSWLVLTLQEVSQWSTGGQTDEVHIMSTLKNINKLYC